MVVVVLVVEICPLCSLILSKGMVARPRSHSLLLLNQQRVDHGAQGKRVTALPLMLLRERRVSLVGGLILTEIK